MNSKAPGNSPSAAPSEEVAGQEAQESQGQRVGQLALAPLAVAAHALHQLARRGPGRTVEVGPALVLDRPHERLAVQRRERPLICTMNSTRHHMFANVFN